MGNEQGQCCGTRTGTGAGTAIKWNHKRLDEKLLGNTAASITIKKAKFFTHFLCKLLFMV